MRWDQEVSREIWKKKLNFDGSNHDSHKWREKLKAHLGSITGLNI